MNDYKWIQNSEYKELPKINIGDAVKLKTIESFEYTIRAIVTKIEDSKITANVNGIFSDGLEITSGDIVKLKGKILSFALNMVQKVY